MNPSARAFALSACHLSRTLREEAERGADPETVVGLARMLERQLTRAGGTLARTDGATVGAATGIPFGPEGNVVSLARERARRARG